MFFHLSTYDISTPPFCHVTLRSVLYVLFPYRSLSIRASTPLPTVGSALYTRLPLPSVVSLRREWNEGRKA